MEKRAADMTFIRDLASRSGIPFELLYCMSNAKPGTIAAAPTSNPTP